MHKGSIHTRYEVSDALPTARGSKDPAEDWVCDIKDLFERL